MLNNFFEDHVKLIDHYAEFISMATDTMEYEQEEEMLGDNSEFSILERKVLGQIIEVKKTIEKLSDIEKLSKDFLFQLWIYAGIDQLEQVFSDEPEVYETYRKLKKKIEEFENGSSS